MAFKLQSFVSHGHIDNRKPDLVTGRLWLYGRETPLELEFEGNCLRDMAGCVTTFRNRVKLESVPRWVQDLQTEQRGNMGDMTASLRVPTAVPASGGNWENLFSLEWFTEELGRVLLETSQYDVEISDHVFQMDAADEQAQLMVNQSTMRDYVHSVLKQAEIRTNTGGDIPPAPFLSISRHSRQIDIVADLYREVCEKYGYNQEGEVSRAYAMGWDHVLGAMAHTEETGEPFFFAEPDPEDMIGEMDELTEEEEARICRGNALYERLQKYAIQAHEWIRHFSVEIVDTTCPHFQLLKGIYSIVEKLALVFVRMERGENDMDRLLEPLNKAMESAEDVRSVFSSMPATGHEKLRDELQGEWQSICKDMAKLRFKLQHRS